MPAPKRARRPKNAKSKSSAQKKIDAMTQELVQFANLDVRESGKVNNQLWSSHTEQNKQLVLDAAALTEKKERCVVIGAGPCYDIPLEDLAKIFDQVELWDLNPASLEQAVSQLPEDLTHKVTCKAVELTHALPRVLHTIKQEFIKAGTRAQRALNKAVTALQKVPVGIGGLAKVEGDLIISDMILSQFPTGLLLADEWYTELYGISLLEQPQWLHAMSQCKERLQNAHIDGLLTKKGAVVVLATDYGMATSAEETDLTSLTMNKRFTLSISTMEKISKIQKDADIERQWIWHRDNLPPKFSPVWGIAFRP
ncbi:MAG: hypothetical protein CL920_36315 [Deltaproteobacteria bacterium]|nr:hypothetical protein [Deltaproteobacteria bacterium]MBU54194.1 hypothetical protein [Deltaproteobacteria bacterium]|tara:strand:- start:24334 stop:25266 length:933 start_codon:yes stop_codon:yes gene_type:complete